jgi:medium-chain acyl-[acyl-carrier-protein] hydrolase
MQTIKLFCFPYAGGSAVIFNQWKRYLQPGIELVAIEYAGRGKRIDEALYKDLPDAIEDLFQLIKPQLGRSPYALFGHSLGGLVVYELAQKIRAHRLPAPMHIFFSGKRAPHIEKKDEKKYHLMDDDEFRKELIGLGGTPPDFFENHELVNVFLPILRNDFKLTEMDTCHGEIHPLDNSISVFLGRDEELTPEPYEEWKKHTKGICNIHYFDGNHFFLHKQAAQVAGLISQTLKNAYHDDSTPFIKSHATHPSE